MSLDARKIDFEKTQTSLFSYRDSYTLQIVNNKGADQTARMCRMICRFVVHMQVRFSRIKAHYILISKNKNTCCGYSMISYQ